MVHLLDRYGNARSFTFDEVCLMCTLNIYKGLVLSQAKMRMLVLVTCRQVYEKNV